MIAAGLGGDIDKHDYRRVVMVNKFPFAGDLGNVLKNSLLVFLHPPPGTKPLEYLLKPQLAFVSVHVHVRGTTQVHTIIRRIPDHCILPNPIPWMHVLFVDGKVIALLPPMKLSH